MSGEFGWPWVAAVIALALHVADEAAHDFLSWYNPQALRIRKFLRIPFPPTFAFWPWIIALVAAVIILAVLTRAAYAGTPWLRPLAIVMGIEHVGNGLPAALPGPPGFHDGRHVRCNPARG